MYADMDRVESRDEVEKVSIMFQHLLPEDGIGEIIEDERCQDSSATQRRPTSGFAKKSFKNDIPLYLHDTDYSALTKRSPTLRGLLKCIERRVSSCGLKVIMLTRWKSRSSIFKRARSGQSSFSKKQRNEFDLSPDSCCRRWDLGKILKEIITVDADILEPIPPIPPSFLRYRA